MSKSVNPLQILQSLSDATVEVVKKVGASVVRVGYGRFGGTGVVWTKDGHIVTAAHVVARLSEVEVGLRDGRNIPAKVLGTDPYSDVALLKVDEKGIEPIEVGDSEGLKVGQFVLALANAFGQEPSVTSGIVTSSKRTITGWRGRMMEDVVITDAPLNPGYSGGPLVDAWGRMVGLNVAFVSSRGIAVPVSTVKTVSDRLATEGKIRRGYLGIASNEISLPKEIAVQPQVNQEEAIILLSVEPGSPAKKAGLAMGDVIVKVDNRPITSLYDLHKLLTQEIIGNETKISLLRGEKLVELKVTPAEARS
jgi:S1-C subfamily serine protease